MGLEPVTSAIPVQCPTNRTAQVVCIATTINHRFVSFSAVQIYGRMFICIRIDVGMLPFIVCSRNTTRKNPAWAFTRNCIGKLKKRKDELSKVKSFVALYSIDCQ